MIMTWRTGKLSPIPVEFYVFRGGYIIRHPTFSRCDHAAPSIYRHSTRKSVVSAKNVTGYSLLEVYLLYILDHIPCKRNVEHSACNRLRVQDTYQILSVISITFVFSLVSVLSEQGVPSVPPSRVC